MRSLRAVVLVAVLALTAACGGQAGNAESGKEFNDADVTFATQMIPHHAQALSMVDLTLGRDLDPEVAAMTEDIRAAQTPEIETMTEWLEDWGKPVPETMRDHANAHGGHADMDSDMPGMMSEQEMAALEKAPDAKFQDMFLEMMIEHHRGAIEMAQTEQEEGQYAPAVELAGKIERSQQAEVEKMERLLGS